MKKVVLLVILLLLLHLSSCSTNNSYTFMQPFENTERIELIAVSPPPYQTYRYKEYAALEPIAEIDKTNWDGFRSALQELECKTYFGDPPTGIYGDAIRITYTDGAIELIGVGAGEYYDSERNAKDRYFYFEQSDYEAFISKWK